MAASEMTTRLRIEMSLPVTVYATLSVAMSKTSKRPVHEKKSRPM